MSLVCHMSRFAVVIALAGLCLRPASDALAGPPAPERPIVITRVAVVDVRRGVLLPDRNVFLQGERIVAVVPAGKSPLPPHARLVSGKNRFLLPGLFDSHVHLNHPERETPLLVANGVTFVRDMGGGASERFAQRKQARQGAYFGLEIACVGTILDGKPAYHPWSAACGTPDEGRAAVRQMAGQGADQIKVYSLLKPDVHRAICDEARKRGLPVVGHVPDALTLSDAAKAGQTGAEHLSGFASVLRPLLPDFTPQPALFDGGIWARYPQVDQAALQAQLTRFPLASVTQCPTLVLHVGHARAWDARTKALWNRYALPDERQSWGVMPAQWAPYGNSLKAALPHLQQALKQMQRASIPLVIGTDLANPGILAGYAVHTEMQLWQDAGLSPAQILRAATLAPARYLRVDKRLGTIETGKTASLVLTRRNPLADVRHASEIEAVFARGRYLNRAALDMLLSKAREEVQAESPAPDANAPLTVPGRIVAQGRYRLFYEQYPDGTEEFVIARDGDNIRFAGVRRQNGFGRYPTVYQGRWASDFAPRDVTLSPRTLLPTIETYTAESGALRGSSARKARTLRRVAIPTRAGTALRGPLAALDYFWLSRVHLLPGQNQTVRAYLIGGKAGPLPQSLTVARQADEAVTLAPNQAPVCQHYTLRSEQEPDTQVDMWTDDRRVPVKQIVRAGGATRSAILDVSNAVVP